MNPPNHLKNAVFIIGFGGSGTTFLGKCLSVLPEFSYHYEPVLTKITCQLIYTGRLNFNLARHVYYSVSSLLMIRHIGQKRRYAEKSPRNCTIVSFLSRAFPESKFIHIVRDGRDSTVSHLKNPWLLSATDHLPFWHPHRYIYGSHTRYWVEPSRKDEFSKTTDTHRIIWNWRAHNEMAIEASRELLTERYLRIHYEDIAANPDAAAEIILDFIKIYDERSRDIFIQQMRKIYTGSIGQWKNSLDEEQLQTIYNEAESMLARFGYIKEPDASGEPE